MSCNRQLLVLHRGNGGTPSPVLLGATAPGWEGVTASRSCSLCTHRLAGGHGLARGGGGGRCPAAPATVLTSVQGGSPSSGQVPASRTGWRGSPGQRAHRAPAHFVVHSVLHASRARGGLGADRAYPQACTDPLGASPAMPGPGEQALPLPPAPWGRTDHGDLPRAARLG